MPRRRLRRARSRRCFRRFEDGSRRCRARPTCRGDPATRARWRCDGRRRGARCRESPSRRPLRRARGCTAPCARDESRRRRCAGCAGRAPRGRSAVRGCRDVRLPRGSTSTAEASRRRTYHGDYTVTTSFPVVCPALATWLSRVAQPPTPKQSSHRPPTNARPKGAPRAEKRKRRGEAAPAKRCEGEMGAGGFEPP